MRGHDNENIRLAATLGHLAARSRRRVYAVGAVCLVVGLLLGRCTTDERVVVVSADDESLEQRVLMLELRCGSMREGL